MNNLKRLLYVDFTFIVLVFLMTRVFFLFVAWIVPSFVHGHGTLGPSLMNGDSGWYLSVAKNGYSHVPYNASHQYNWAFYPMYPYLTRWIGGVWGTSGMKMSGYVISNVSFLSFLYVLYKWSRSLTDHKTARVTAILAAVTPILPYFVGYRPASLFMLLSVLSLYFMSQEKWLLATVFGALTSLDRPTGLLLAIPYILYILLKSEYPFWKKFLWLIPASLFWTGFVSLMFTDYHLTGNALAFMKIESQWNRHLILPFKLWWDWIKNPTLLDSSWWGSPPFAILMSVIVLLSSLIFLRRRRFWPLVAYIVIPTIFVNSYTVFNGVQRYVLELVPVYLALAIISRRFKLENVLTTSFWVTMTLYSVFWSLGVHAVLS